MQQVLVVDDNEDIRSALRAILEDAGYEVGEARDGREAIAVATRRCPNVILLDLNLPPSDGFQVLRQITTEPALKRVPVIIVTGSVNGHHLRAAKQLGAWDYITKPWAIGEVEARVRLALQAIDPADQSSGSGSPPARQPPAPCPERGPVHRERAAPNRARAGRGAAAETKRRAMR